jgi:integrase
LIEFLEEGNKRMKKRTGTEILNVTYMKYKRSVAYMKDFLQAEYKVKNFSLQKVNMEFLEQYFQYLRTEKKIAHNTACKYLVCVKTIFSPAIRNGIIKPDPFYGLRLSPKPVFKDILTQDEIDKIVALELKDLDLDRKRDIFLFACYTGLVYIDLQQLNRDHLIKESDNSWYIRKPHQKTGEKSIIPLLPVAMRILTKYSLTGNIADFNWHVSTNQKMNKGLNILPNELRSPKTCTCTWLVTALRRRLRWPMVYPLKRLARCSAMPVSNKHSITQSGAVEDKAGYGED